MVVDAEKHDQPFACETVGEWNAQADRRPPHNLRHTTTPRSRPLTILMQLSMAFQFDVHVFQDITHNNP
jgi:hypothetical protein